MKAVAIEQFGGVENLHIEEIATPVHKDHEVLVQIAYTAVNPVDWKIREGFLKSRLPHKFPIVLGWDAAGTVTAVGAHVKDLKPGDEVFAYCRQPTVQWGTYAEYIALDASAVALKPRNINFAEAAAIPLTGLTAWQALFDFAHLNKGETILIHAGAGGVGSLAIQFAKIQGATVITTASEKNHAYVKSLGADHAIDYTKQDFVQKTLEIAPLGADVIFDTIGGKTLTDSFEAVKPGGCVVSIVQEPDTAMAEEKDVKAGFVFVTPSGQELKKIADLITEGKVVPPQIEEMPLEKAGEAHEKIRKGHTRGKIVLKVM